MDCVNEVIKMIQHRMEQVQNEVDQLQACMNTLKAFAKPGGKIYLAPKDTAIGPENTTAINPTSEHTPPIGCPEPRKEAHCPGCNVLFEKRKASQVYCSNLCKEKDSLKAHTERNGKKIITLDEKLAQIKKEIPIKREPPKIEHYF